MGCRLNKSPKPEAPRPGNIYSTLKRPQVETKTDVSYEYRFLDFTTLDNGIPNCTAIRISSLCDLPGQLQELYQQGFVLAAVHPFVQPAAGKEWNPLEHIFRAVLIKRTQRSEKPDPPGEAFSLVVECCLSTDRLTGQTIQPDFVKTVEDAAVRGLKFVGIVHQNSGASGKNSPGEPPAYNNLLKAVGSVRTTPNHGPDPEGHGGMDGHLALAPNDRLMDQPKEEGAGNEEHVSLEDFGSGRDGEMLLVDTPKEAPIQGEPMERQDNEAQGPVVDEHRGKAEIFAIFNKPPTHRRYDYYTVKVPIRVSRNGQSVSTLEANWLEHMTEHFKRGGSLVNTAFYPGMVNESSPGSTDGVFVFEDTPEADKVSRGYDAIVVEQLTILEGTRVQTDYVPLLNSLADYGWQLKCVLPTPLMKTDSEGNVTTKQIVFLQRPFLPNRGKKKESRFPWKFSKNDKQGRKSRKSAKEKANSRKRNSVEKKIEENREENERNAGVVTKTHAIENYNPERENDSDEVTNTEAEDFQERCPTPGQPELQESAQTMLRPSSPSGTGLEEAEEASALQEHVPPLYEEDTTGADEKASQSSTREMEGGLENGTMAEPQESDALAY
ncbi:raftlin [Ambystoma mexicanum]|uniref:raftlin n=1 Tax=Ambystoma mexicanum TaxID=8296 RepID=UPI0037E7B032